MSAPRGFQFAIDRGGTFTDVFARCPDGSVKVLKLLSEDPKYDDAPTEGIRRVLREVGAETPSPKTPPVLLCDLHMRPPSWDPLWDPQQPMKPL